jgi:hypothetical protein
VRGWDFWARGSGFRVKGAIIGGGGTRIRVKDLEFKV